MTRQKIAAWLTVFTLTLCVTGLVPAFLLIEHNIRQTLTGHTDPGLAFSLEEGRPVLTDTADGQPLSLLSSSGEQGLAALLPPGIRAVWGLLRRETEAINRLWEQAAATPGCVFGATAGW